ncbi:hypothetical protein MU582_08325 [Nocardioidaceae bacterium SCSIO 66511]|nr:hypothetical protein MU582_08325 [Nocardioidaceae bacterium SCSIO 66511]
MTSESATPTFGSMAVAYVVVAIIRLPMAIVTAVVAVGLGLVGDFDVGVRRAIGLAAVAWALWPLILVPGAHYLSRRRDSGTTRIDVVVLECAATVGSLLVSAALFAGGPFGGLAYGLVAAAIMCLVTVVTLTRGRPFSTDWRTPTACSVPSNPATDEPEFGA